MTGNCPACGALGTPGKRCPACGHYIPTTAEIAHTQALLHQINRRLWAEQHIAHLQREAIPYSSNMPVNGRRCLVEYCD